MLHYHLVSNTSTGALCLGDLAAGVSVGDFVHISGEARLRRVTSVMGARPPRVYAAFKGQGPVPTGQVRFAHITADTAATSPDFLTQVATSPTKVKEADAQEVGSLVPDVAILPDHESLTGEWSLLVIGFDSAWTRHNSGALHGVWLGPNGPVEVVPAQACSFDQAWQLISRLRKHNEPILHTVDQPLIVPNLSGRRPVEDAVSPTIGRCQSGMQPANRSRIGMFDDAAPIWEYLGRWRQLGATLDPESVPGMTKGLAVVEVYPALALLGLFPRILTRSLPKYNPDRGTFRQEDWTAVCMGMAQAYDHMGLEDPRAACEQLASLENPRKPDQDKCDAMICTLAGLVLWARGWAGACRIGDTTSGYIVTPTRPNVVAAIQPDAIRAGVPIRFDPPIEYPQRKAYEQARR